MPDGGPAGGAGDPGSLGSGGNGAGGSGGGGAGYHGGGAGGGTQRAFGGAGGGGGGSSWVNQDFTGVDQYLTHITGASSTAASGAPRIIISYTESIAPAVSAQSPAAQQQTGARPAFSGSGGTDHGDQPNVTVSIHSGQAAKGSPVQTLSPVIDSAGRYQASANAPLASGTYTAQTSQHDNAGNTGRPR